MAHSDTLQAAPRAFAKSGAERIAGTVIVVALHGAALYALMSHRILPVPDEVVTLFVETITLQPPPAPKEAPKPQPEKPRPVEKPQPRQIAAAAPVLAPSDYVAPPPPPAPVVEAPPRPAGPVTLSAELSVSCPERQPPAYPPLSRRLGEEGKVVLRVELDERGGVGSARVEMASGFPRLDEAALAAVKTWRCNPARRDGQPVRAIALQPFKFVLQ